jgi:hypothetical protein
MNQWSQPTEITNVFDVKRLMPEYKDIPREFKDIQNPHVKFQSKWFFEGLDKLPAAKEGIDQVKAMCHLAAIQSSFEPSHEHKQAAVAYLASLWLQIEDNGCLR